MSNSTLAYEDELLNEPLPPTRRRTKLITRSGAALIAVSIAGLGFLGGVQVQKSQDDSTGTNTAGFPGGGAPGGAAPGGRTPGGAQPGAGAQGGATIGEVSSVDGSTIYVKDTTGNTVRVKARDNAKVSRTAKADADEIHPGDTVVIQGETADSGTVVATSVTATAEGIESGGGLFGGSGAPGGFTPPAGG
jgi:hypothetical protein